MLPNLDLTPDLIVVSTFLGNVILINQSGIFWASTSKVICYVDPLCYLPLLPYNPNCMVNFLAIPSPSKGDALVKKIIFHFVYSSSPAPPFFQ